MTYKVKSFHRGDGLWEAKYVEPEGKVLAGNLVQIPDSFLLGKRFVTKEETDRYTLEFLKNKGIKEEEIEVLE